MITGTAGTGAAAAGWMTIVSVWVAVPPAFVAVTVTVEVPVAVGVPEMMPVAGSIVRPAGKPVAAKAVGLNVAVTAKLNATLTVPVVTLPLVMVGATSNSKIEPLASFVSSSSKSLPPSVVP